MAALSIWQKVKLAWHLLTTKDPIRYVLVLSLYVELKIINYIIIIIYYMAGSMSRQDELNAVF